MSRIYTRSKYILIDAINAKNMEKYEPTEEKIKAAEENMTEEQKAASARREEARANIKPHKEIPFTEEGMQIVGEEEEFDKNHGIDHNSKK